MSSLLIQHDLVKELSFINYFHSDWRNRIVHLFAVPCFDFAMVSLLWYLPTISIGQVSVSAPLLFTILILSFYAYLDPLVASIWSMIFGILWIGASKFHAATGSSLSYAPFLFGIILAAEVVQFFSHLYFEKKKPAFRLFEATVTTPFFIILVLLFALGYRQELKRMVEMETPNWRGAEKGAGAHVQELTASG